MCGLLFCQLDRNYSRKDRNWNEIHAWLVNFILSFNGLSPILIGPKVNFFKLTWQRRPQQCARLLHSTQPKWACPNQISSKKATIGPNKIFFGIYEQHLPTGIVLGSTQLQTGPILFYDAYDLSQLACHIGCHIRFCPAWQSYRTKVMTHCIYDFPRVIKLMTLRNKVSSLIAGCDARLMMERFRNNRHH
jgi:hypothetical protein